MGNSEITREFANAIEYGVLPQMIYKYCSIDTAKSILRNSSLKFNCPFEYNDPFECKADIKTDATFDQIVQWLNRLKLNNSKTRKEKREKAKELAKDQQKMRRLILDSFNVTTKKMRVCCFSENNKNILLWSHYSQEHKGVCLKFDILADPEFFFPITRIKYESEVISYNHILDFEEGVYLQMKTKSKDWEYEKELRVIKMRGDDFYHFKKAALSEVIFGCRSDIKSINEIKKLLNTNNYQSTVLKKAIQVKDKYALEIIEL